MQCYTELLPPTAVTHALALPFLAPSANNLVVAKTSLLQIFTVKPRHPLNTFNGVANGSATTNATSKLVLVGEYPLSGTITALAAVKIAGTRSGGDALLIALRDAKLSLVEWDPENHRISTISIHYYEGESVLSQPFGPSLSDADTILTVDPSSRCAALKFAARHLAILPFRQSGEELGEGLDDGYDVDADRGPVSAQLRRRLSGVEAGLDGEAVQTPYKASFVLPLTALDPSLTHPVHLAFLHEYREPTFGILSSPFQASVALLDERKDCLTYSVFTLDLEQRASTNLISVPKLPSTLWKVVPLQLPVGGALLVGTNELVHVDQSGKTNAIAVNAFARDASNFSMIDQSSLNIKLEGCEVEPLDSGVGDLLIVLNDGSLAILGFRLLGRNVGGLSLIRVPSDSGGALPSSTPSAAVALCDNHFFFGSEDGDSALVQWTSEASILSRKRSHTQMLDIEPAPEFPEDVEDVDEDDLYAPSADTLKRTASAANRVSGMTALSYTFRLHDTLHCLGPINNVCLGRPPKAEKHRLALYAGVGRGKSSKIACVTKDIMLQSNRSINFAGASNLWSVRIRQAPEDGESQDESQFDQLLFVYDGDSTRAFHVASTQSGAGAPDTSPASNGYAERKGTEFEHDGETVALFTMADDSRVIQCRRTEIRSYDSELSLSQIIPMVDEETDAELKIVATSVLDPYLLIIRDDSSIQILKVDSSGDVEPLDSAESIMERKWMSGCLYGGELTDDEPCAFLLGEEGGLHILGLPGLERRYTASTLPQLPPVLSAEPSQRRTGLRETLTELLVADLGMEVSKEPCLIVRSALDDLTLYEPYYWKEDNKSTSGFAALRFRKLPNTAVPKYDERLSDIGNERPSRLKSLTIGGYHTVYIPSAKPSMIVKEPASRPHIVALRAGNVKAVAPLDREGCKDGFALLSGDGLLEECSLLADTWLGTGWSVRFLNVGQPGSEVRHIAYHEGRGVYVAATCRYVDYYFPDDDIGRHQDQGDAEMCPQTPQYTLHLISATSYEILSSVEMPYADIVTSLKVIPLEMSEHTHEQRACVAVCTVAQLGEDTPAKGAVTVFDIIDVVPEPNRPETGIRLKVFAREETRGAVTAVESFPGGLLGTAQGQKIMIRGLKEDGSCLPVAFLDAQCHITVLKALGQTGMWLAGDAWKGLWFGGFTEEPYRLTLLGKGRPKMEIMTADLLPFDGQLYLLVIDANMDLHVLQYDPENPKSLSGTRLLHRAAFHLGHFPTTMTLVPSTLSPFTDQPLTNGNGETHAPHSPLFHILTTSQSGSVGLITPVDEDTYRRLSALQTHLTSVLEHPAGLNPRAYRAVVETEGGSAGGTRGGIVDGSLVQRVGELGAARRAEVLGRAGMDSWGLRSDLEILGGGGLGYL